MLLFTFVFGTFTLGYGRSDYIVTVYEAFVFCRPQHSTLRLFDKSTGEMLCEYTGHRSEKYKIEACLTNNDAFVVGGSEDGKIRIWKLVEGEIVETLKGHTKEVVSLDYHPKKTCLVTASSDGTIRCWK